MRLVNIGLGEVADRLSILALKIAYAEQDGKEATHFATERAALMTKLTAFTISTGALEAIFGLATVNGMLWHAEDVIREFRRAAGDVIPVEERTRDAVVMVAFRIQQLNDQRATLVRALNQLAGTDLGAEKL